MEENKDISPGTRAGVLVGAASGEFALKWQRLGGDFSYAVGDLTGDIVRALLARDPDRLTATIDAFAQRWVPRLSRRKQKEFASELSSLVKLVIEAYAAAAEGADTQTGSGAERDSPSTSSP